MNKITVYRKPSWPYYYTRKHGDSELLLSHLTHGESKYYFEMHEDIEKLANAHGWTIEVKDEK